MFDRSSSTKYSDDEPINKASVEPFTQFLSTLRDGVPKKTRIHILVHSMGNRIVMESLNALPEPVDQKPFSHVVLCAPDFGRSDFIQWAPGVVAQSDRVTLYVTASDSALIVSKGLHAEKRAGDAVIPLVVEGIETIDCSRIDQSLMGHQLLCRQSRCNDGSVYVAEGESSAVAEIVSGAEEVERWRLLAIRRARSHDDVQVAFR